MRQNSCTISVLSPREKEEKNNEVGGERERSRNGGSRETVVVVIYTSLIWTISCWSFAPRVLNAFSIGKGGGGGGGR